MDILRKSYCNWGIALIIALTSTACSSFSDLYGSWERTGYFEPGDDGISRVAHRFDFSDGYFKRTVTIYLDDMIIGQLSVSGDWSAHETDMVLKLNKDVKGVIRLDYRLSSLQYEFDDNEIDAETQAEIVDSWTEYIRTWNEETEKTYGKHHKRVKFYYGLYIHTLSDNELSIEEDGENVTYYKR